MLNQTEFQSKLYTKKTFFFSLYGFGLIRVFFVHGTLLYMTTQSNTIITIIKLLTFILAS